MEHEKRHHAEKIEYKTPTPQNNRNTQDEIRLTDFLHAIYKRKVLIVVLTAIGLVFGVFLSVLSFMRGEMSKQYAINTSIAVTSQNENGLFTAQTNNPNSTDIHLAEDMVDSVIYVLKSDKMLVKAVDRMDLLGITPKDIANNLEMVQYKDTQIIDITLYWRSAQEGVEILNAMNEVAPGVLSETLKIGNVSIINNPTARYLIGGNINAAMWGYMAALGLLLGVGLAVLEILLRPTLLDSDDMEKVFSIEVLGEIPERNKFFHQKRNLLISGEANAVSGEVLDNYISIAHILRRRLEKMEHPCVYVTSATGSEGKTTVTAYLAVQLAELGLKVLIIDFDTRNPKLGGFFLKKVEYAHSMNALYRGDAAKEDAITHLTGNLDILPAVLERKPITLDDALLTMVSELRFDYDVVLMDTSPVGLVADTMSLNKLADIALLVVRFDGASMDSIREAQKRLVKSGMDILGCVVNGVKDFGRRNRYGYYYGYGYHSHSGNPYRTPEKTESQREWETWEASHATENSKDKGVREDGK